MSPVMFRTQNLQFVIRTKEQGHPLPHVHVIGRGTEAVINLITGEVIHAGDFSDSALRRIVDEVMRRQRKLLEAWNEYHSD